MAGTRKDIAKLSDPWAPELLWYARAVAALRQRAAADRTSWRYLGAIHGINIDGWITQSLISSAADLPPQREQDFLFNQCQHAGWFFLPWHRGYLAAFEAILDDWIQNNGGPTDWALPYWNYLDDSNPNARDMPQAFLDATLPDGTSNPLADANRTGSNTLGPQTWIPRDISLDAQTGRSVYTANPGTIGYGGAISGFAHQGDLTGGVEGDPHNPVHVMIGGPAGGWMSDPDFAALDPIFWMHHCNIDRLWEAWMSDTSHDQETSSAWRNGPFPQQFLMPNAQGGVDVFTPGDTLPSGSLAPQYDDIHEGTGIVAPIVVTEATGTVPPLPSSSRPSASTLIGASDQPVSVSGQNVTTKVTMETAIGGAITETPLGKQPEVFLNLEGVKGTVPSGVLNVYLTAPGQTEPELIDSVVLFGLAKASKTEGRHAGNGLTTAVDISDFVANLTGAALNEIEVQLSQPGDPTSEITVDRISIFTQ